MSDLEGLADSMHNLWLRLRVLEEAMTRQNETSVHQRSEAALTEALENRARIERLETLVTELYMWYQEQKSDARDDVPTA